MFDFGQMSGVISNGQMHPLMSAFDDRDIAIWRFEGVHKDLCLSTINLTRSLPQHYYSTSPELYMTSLIEIHTSYPGAIENFMHPCCHLPRLRKYS